MYHQKLFPFLYLHYSANYESSFGLPRNEIFAAKITRYLRPMISVLQKGADILQSFKQQEQSYSHYKDFALNKD
ncbi:hypothetical protein ACT8ZS_07250 [Paenibacillus sp. M.A.Huq-84]